MSAGVAILDAVEKSRLPETSRFAGMVTTGELRRFGLSPAQVRTLVQRQVLSPLALGVYAPGTRVSAERTRGLANEHRLKVAAALAAAKPGPVASHASAAIIHGLDLLSRTNAVHLTRPPGCGSRSGPPGVHIHVASLPPGHGEILAGIPVTTVARTVIDLARTTSFRAGVAAADSALRGQRASRRELESVIADCHRWRGIKQARRVAAFCDERSESALESISRVMFADHGLPAPELQVWVGGEEGAIGRADFLWQAYRTIGEADGLGKYSDPSRAFAQLQRDARLREAGFEVVHFTWQEVTCAPGRVVASIRAAFQRGTAR